MLKVKGIYGGYEKRPIVKNISFSIRRGEMVGIIGPNGSGKTTLLKMISGGLPLQSGDVSINGVALKGYESSELAQIMAVLPQSTASSFSYSVKETVSLGRYPYQKGLFRGWSNVDETAVQKAMKMTNVHGFEYQDLLTLSGGEKQRVFLAQALAQEPSLLLLDEPTNHLDLSHQKGLMDLLKEWTTKNELTVISVFHDLNLASLYCDRILMIDRGEIISFGTPWDVLKEEQVQQVYGADVKRQPHPSVPRPQLAIMPTVQEDKDEFPPLTESFLEYEQNHIVFRSPIPLKAISSSVFNSGLGWYSTFVNRHVGNDYNCEDTETEMKTYLVENEFKLSDTVAMMTAINLEDRVCKVMTTEEVSLLVVVTAGVGNAVDISKSIEHDRNLKTGTINTWIFLNGTLSDEAFIQAVMIATEAKTKALFDMDITDNFSKSSATGTSTDSILVAATQKGKTHAYAGSITPIGKAIGKQVYEATVEAIKLYTKRKQDH